MLPTGKARHQLSLRLYERMQYCLSQGDECGWMSARADLYHLYEQQALSWAWKAKKRWLGDLQQETRLAVLDAIAIWDPERGPFVVPLTYAVRKRIATFLRREGCGPKPEQAQDYVEQEAGQNGPNEAQSAGLLSLSDSWEDSLFDPEDGIEQRLLQLAIRQALERLPQPQRQAVVTYYGIGDGRDKSLRETGSLLGISQVAVKARVDKALPQLRQVLESWR
jgi:RNA polymerase sigma factor (sigma-70 family)